MVLRFIRLVEKRNFICTFEVIDLGNLKFLSYKKHIQVSII